MSIITKIKNLILKEKNTDLKEILKYKIELLAIEDKIKIVYIKDQVLNTEAVISNITKDTISFKNRLFILKKDICLSTDDNELYINISDLKYIE